ncbi:MAG: hypothetical protein CM1200mP30_27650 [Pseudomonadota bacterium]|nr:MAG: hypothetical protein CM1200mP30_27650 [Pseudomonadota bacterium]
MSKRLNERGLELADTDWHINRLYDGLLQAGTVVKATFSRYVFDANRDPSGASLYPDKTPLGYVPPQILRERQYIIKEKNPTRPKLSIVRRFITHPIMLN